MNRPGEPKDVEGLADWLGVSKRWVYDQVAAGTIPYTRLPGRSSNNGKLIRFSEEMANEILAAYFVPVASTPVRGAA